MSMLNENLAHMVVVFAAASVGAALLYFKGDASVHITKARLSRVRGNAKIDPKTVHDVPSIVREQTIFLKKSRSRGKHTRLAKCLSDLEHSLRASGMRVTGRQFFVLLAVFSIIQSLVLSVKLSIDLFIAMPMSLAMSFFILIRYINYRKRRQIQRFQELFPDALDLIVRSVKAGLPVTEAIKVISSEVAAPVNGAFREVSNSLAIGISLEEALVNLQKMVPVAEVKFFVISLTIQQETGGNLAEILANLAKIMRKRVQVHKKVRALSSEARASAYIIGSLPFLVASAIYVLNRQYIEMLFYDNTGQLLLATALSSIFVGAVVIAKLIRFEV